MRDIKYRAWIESEKIMRNDIAAIDFENEILYFVNKDNCMNNKEKREFCYKPYTLMEYTGLIDKNGVEIYEGDVILIANKSYKNKATVEWSVLGVKWVLVYNDLSVYELATWHESVYEVIGNIYENPELIEVSNNV